MKLLQKLLDLVWQALCTHRNRYCGLHKQTPDGKMYRYCVSCGKWVRLAV
jgi:hypothetical protein